MPFAIPRNVPNMHHFVLCNPSTQLEGLTPAVGPISMSGKAKFPDPFRD
jgi:hypothetical protein